MHKKGQGRGRHPPWLKGREIGLFYMRQSKKHRKREEEQSSVSRGPSIALSERAHNEVNKLLEKYESEEDDVEVSNEFKMRFQSLLSESFDEFIERKKLKVNPENPSANDSIFASFEKQKKSRGYIEFLKVRNGLPAAEKRQLILDTIEQNQVVLILGSTGCGKTTQVPQFILDKYIEAKQASKCRILCSQPRRISAIMVSERVAAERNEQLGGSTGYCIRMDGVQPRKNGSILFCSTGTLLRFMETDPLLYSSTHVIIDEIHERSVESDLILGLLKKIQPYRPDLKIILMSATVSQAHFEEYFNDCATIEISGTLFSVEEEYLEDVLQLTHFTDFPSHPPSHGRKQLDDLRLPDDRLEVIKYAHSIRSNYDNHVIKSLLNPNSEKFNVQLLESLIIAICDRKPPGAILVFLPSYSQILILKTLLENSFKLARHNPRIYCLHSSVATADQKAVFVRPPDSIRKIIISTNIAESSVTIDDVVYVINSGVMKCNNYDVKRKVEVLEDEWISKANADQRRGRAGRVQNGICYHLYSRAREGLLNKSPIPEIVRSKLECVVLRLKLLHINDVAAFLSTLLDCPSEEAIIDGIHLLKGIDALNEFEIITPLGMHLARLPIDPQLGKMLLMGTLFRCLDPICSAVSVFGFKDPFYRPFGKEKLVHTARQELSDGCNSDLLLIHNVIEKFREAKQNYKESDFCRRNFLSKIQLQQLERAKLKFCEFLKTNKFLESDDPFDDLANMNSNKMMLLRAVIAAGLYPNVAHLTKIKRRGKRCVPIHSIKTKSNEKVIFHPSSVNSAGTNFDSHYFAYFVKQRMSNVFLMDSTMIFPMSLAIFAGEVECLQNENGSHSLLVSNFFTFKSDEPTNNLILKLRTLFSLLMKKKALYPSPIQLQSKDETLLNAIKVVLLDEGDNDYKFEYNEPPEMSDESDE